MRKKLPFTLGTLGLAMAGSLFLGCQDFLGGDNGKQAAPADNGVEHAAQAADPAGITVAAADQPALAPQAAVTQDSAKDMPAQPAATAPAQSAATEPAKPAEPDPAKPSPAPASTALSPEQQACLDLSNVLQSGTTTNENYSQAKGQYLEKNCSSVPAPYPYTPPPIEERCKLYRVQLTETRPVDDGKYQAYLDDMAKQCAAVP
jgi:hypothetical protein